MVLHRDASLTIQQNAQLEKPENGIVELFVGSENSGSHVKSVSHQKESPLSEDSGNAELSLKQKARDDNLDDITETRAKDADKFLLLQAGEETRVIRLSSGRQ